MPHDVVASEDKTVFVGDVHARAVWKFASTESMFFLVLMSQLHILYLRISTTYLIPLAKKPGGLVTMI